MPSAAMLIVSALALFWVAMLGLLWRRSLIGISSACSLAGFRLCFRRRPWAISGWTPKMNSGRAQLFFAPHLSVHFKSHLASQLLWHESRDVAPWMLRTPDCSRGSRAWVNGKTA